MSTSLGGMGNMKEDILSSVVGGIVRFKQNILLNHSLFITINT